MEKLIIGDKLVVSINYKLTDGDGELIEANEDDAPLSYFHGADQIVPGLERELTGKTAGDQVEVKVEPADGYGDVDPQKVIEVPKDQVGGEVTPGDVVQAELPNGGLVPFMVSAVGDDTVTLDGNHPLAGKTLNFDVTVVEVREPTEEEASHGHVHGEGCQH